MCVAADLLRSSDHESSGAAQGASSGSRISSGAGLDCGRDASVGVDLGLVESGPADPHVEERQPSESAGHALIGALLRGVACACTSVDGEEEGGDEGDGGKDRRTHGELLELLGNHCEAIKCQSQINLIKNYLTSITRKD